MTDVTQIADVIGQLARFTQTEGRTSNLTSAQWCALRFFARAIRTSRTISSFADYHHTTRGTASQTVKSLVSRRLLDRTRSTSDRRTIYIDLTDEGRDAWHNDPFEILVKAIAALPQAQQQSLVAILPPLMKHMAEQLQVPCLGTCGTCCYLKTLVSPDDVGTTYFCREHKAPVSSSDLDAICMSYKSNTALD